VGRPSSEKFTEIIEIKIIEIIAINPKLKSRWPHIP